MSEYPAQSTYRAVVDVVDKDGSPIDLSNATLSYVLSDDRSGSDIAYDVGETADAVAVQPNETTGRIVVTIPASDVPQGVFYEELRVTLDESLVVNQRPISFRAVATDPP